MNNGIAECRGRMRRSCSDIEGGVLCGECLSGSEVSLITVTAYGQKRIIEEEECRGIFQ